MTHPEFVADRLRREWLHLHHRPLGESWERLLPSEKHVWLELARVAMDADSAWRPAH